MLRRLLPALLFLIAVLPAKAAAQQIFVRGTDSQLWGKWHDGLGWTTWQPLGGATIHSSPDACASAPTADATLSVVALGADRAIVLRERRGGRWGDWHSLGGEFDGAPSIVCGTDGVDIFGRGMNHAIWHYRLRHDGTRVGWHDLGGRFKDGPDAAAGDDGALFVVARGMEDSVYILGYAGGTWGGWVSLGGEFSSRPSIVSWRNGRRTQMEVFGLGVGQEMLHATVDRFEPLAWASRGGQFNGPPSAAAPANRAFDEDFFHIYARGSDDAVWSMAFGDLGWTQWMKLDEGVARDGPGVASGVGPRLDERGTYRITVSRVRTDGVTVDHALSADGKGDEIFVEAFAVEITADGRSPSAYRRTRVMGDTNGLPGRIRAGSISTQGGFTAGDSYRLPGDNRREPALDDMPLLVWEGELRDAANGLLVVPSVWEYDGDDSALRPAWSLLVERWISASAAAHWAAVQAGGTEMPRAVPADDLRLQRPIPDAFSGSETRPIGMERAGGFESFVPRYLLLTFRNVEASLRAGVEGLAPGSFVVRYFDAPELGGRYTLTVRVERMH